MTTRDMKKLTKGGYVLIHSNAKKMTIEKFDSIKPYWHHWYGPFKTMQELRARERDLLNQRFIIKP